MQILKLQEEVGEVAQAFIGWTGQNTRKGITHSTDDIVAELVDVAITAMAGIATMSMLDGPQDDTFEYAREKPLIVSGNASKNTVECQCQECLAYQEWFQTVGMRVRTPENDNNVA